MTVNYIWKIDQLTAYPTYENQTDVVFKVTWSYCGVNADGIGSSRGGITEVSYKAGAPFTPFAELTLDQVLNWIKPTISTAQIANMETDIMGDIEWLVQQANANTPTNPPLPWLANQATSVK